MPVVAGIRIANRQSGKVSGNIDFLSAGAMRVVYQSGARPNQAFSAGPRLSDEERARLSAALLAPEAEAPTAKIREAYTGGKAFVAATNAEYAGLGEYLRDEWGYYQR